MRTPGEVGVMYLFMLVFTVDKSLDQKRVCILPDILHYWSGSPLHESKQNQGMARLWR